MANTETGLNLICMENVVEQELKWLWGNYIAFGKITIIQGDPGTGKSILILNLAACLSRGESLDDGSKTEPINIIYQNAEDGLADTIKPRLVRAGADCSKIKVIDENINPLSIADNRLEEAIVETKAKLVILDPLQAYLGTGTNMNRADDMRNLTKKLSNLAEKYQCAIVLIGHMNKSAKTQAAYRGLGSIDLYAVARSVLLVGKMPDNEDQRVMLQIKNNLSKFGNPKAFEIVDGAVKWLGDIEITEEELLKAKKNGGSKMERAKALISDTLAMQGSITSKEMFSLAEKEGIKTRTLEAAKKELGIVSEKVLNEWWWKIPAEQ